MTLKPAIRCFLISLALGLIFHNAKAVEIRPVQKGDKITLRRSALISTDNVVVIKWTQNSVDKCKDYIQTSARYTIEGDDETVELFIQRDMVDDFMGDCEGGQSPAPGSIPPKRCSIVVNGDFQYGQFKEKKKIERFLVYHEKANKPYQQSFACTLETTTNKGFGSFMSRLDKSLANISLPTKLLGQTNAPAANSVNTTNLTATASTNNPLAAVENLTHGSTADQIQAGAKEAESLGIFSKIGSLGSGSGEYLQDF